MESPIPYPDSPLDQDEAAYPCKGCGKILEEGKAFELAGNRWHINCFRCNTCETLLDSDANLLLLGDGSLICNNCTYSCSNCGNKIEDLAILTGDQAFCATCFKCRNCKKKIENLRYARTSQGIFCMDCHEALMARRRKKTARNAAQRQKVASNNSAQLDKSLPSLPPSEARKHAFSPPMDSPVSESFSNTPTETPAVSSQPEEMQNPSKVERRDRSPAGQTYGREGLTLPATAFQNHRQSVLSQRSDVSGGEEFLIPLAFDPNPPRAPSPNPSNQRAPRALDERPRDYFSTKASSGSTLKESLPGSITNTPHIAFQEKNRQASNESKDTIRKRLEGSTSRAGSATASPFLAPNQGRQQVEESPSLSQGPLHSSAVADKFKLQEAPRTKKPPGSARTSWIEATQPQTDASNSLNQVAISTKSPMVQEPEPAASREIATPPRSSYEYSPVQSSVAGSPKPLQHPATGQLQNLPKRGDSLDSSKRNKVITRKELNAAATIPQALNDVLSHAGSGASNTNAEAPANLSKLNNGKVISNPIESPNSKSIFDTPNVVQSVIEPGTGEKPKESFVATRVPPLPPSDTSRPRNESIGLTQADTTRLAEHQISPSLPRYSAGGDFTLEEDMARILGSDEPTAHESFLRRVSNSVRHGRSYSDKSGRMSRDSRWPRSPNVNNATTSHDISSPSTASPENREELAWFKNELRRERQKTVEKDKRIADLEAALDATANIKQVNADLREKRSTMVVLDTQKEIVVRELEVLTEHIAAAKKSNDPLDLGGLTSAVLKDFAEALQKLKESFRPQIEESIQKRNDLLDEVSNLTQMKDKNLQEFEQLSSKNAQLAELNNQLVHQIQELYKANAGPSAEPMKPTTPNGLGIYSHHKERSQMSVDSRVTTEMSIQSSGATLLPEEAEPVAVLQGPQVVNIRKGQPKKFNWKKGGQNVAKGVTKGLKGAFSSTQQSYARELQFAETAPYGAAPMGQEYSTLPRNNQEPIKQGFGFFGNQKMPPKSNGLFKGQSNDSTPSLLLDASAHLYGSDLEQRVEYERTPIPAIVSRCIEEVEARGMDVEGIYRKSGGNSQVQAVRDAFERSPSEMDLSDPDLDIHAVTSGLKQYFRRLPNPLITYEVYDTLLDTTTISEPPARIEAMRQALTELPKVHYEVLEFLMRHLKRVVAQEKENLMTSSNVAVVFAPTIMRPESLGRELNDTKSKNEVVQWMVENVLGIFGKASSNLSGVAPAGGSGSSSM